MLPRMLQARGWSTVGYLACCRRSSDNQNTSPSALGVSAPRASPRHAAKPPLHTTRQYRYVVEVVSRENLEKVLDTILDCSPLGGSLVILDIFFDAIM